MLALAVTRVVEHRCWWARSTKGFVIPDVDPASPRVGLSFGQHWYSRIIGMKPLGRHDMGFN
jgi:hypothetical protein